MYHRKHFVTWGASVNGIQVLTVQMAIKTRRKMVMRKGTKMVMKKMTNKMMAKPNTIASGCMAPSGGL